MTRAAHQGRRDIFTPTREGGAWRVYPFVEDTRLPPESGNAGAVLLLPPGPSAISRRMLQDYPGDTLFETIEKFHDTEDRLAQVRKGAGCGRRHGPGEGAARRRSTFVKAQASRTAPWRWRRCAPGRLPLRVTHNDTKLNNILIDRRHRRGHLRHRPGHRDAGPVHQRFRRFHPLRREPLRRRTSAISTKVEFRPRAVRGLHPGLPGGLRRHADRRRSWSTCPGARS